MKATKSVYWEQNIHSTFTDVHFTLLLAKNI